MRPAHIGAIAAARQQDGGAPPSGEAHRYWRILVTGIEGGAPRVNVAEIEFWDRRYARRLSGTYSESGASSGTAGIAYNGVREYAGSPAQTYWISNDGPGIWLKVDAGSAVELAAVVVWRSNLTVLGGANGNHIAAFDVQYSDDDTSWTTLWSESGSPLIPDAATPGLFDNPYYSGDPAPALDPTITPLHWLKLDGLVYSDAGSTPAGDNDGIYQATNYGSDGTAFIQTTSGQRPTFKAGGLNGKPFLRCARASTQRFGDIAITQPSGFGALSPFCVAMVTDNIDLTSEAALLGSTASGGGKIGVYFRSAANAQIHIGKAGQRFGNVVNPQTLLLSRMANTRLVGIQNGARTLVESFTNEVSDAIAAANLLWNDGLANDGYFDGDLYEWMYIDAVTDETVLFRIAEYLNAKFGGIY